tara:strand:- start:25658 stop:26161 length:504 start_codon:yes stop_codon:yes gene_type:complete
MNKKALSVILGIVVLFVWYKVISSFFGENIESEPFQQHQAHNNLDLSKIISNDSIPQPKLNYRDPFLGKVSFHNSIQPKRNSSTQAETNRVPSNGQIKQPTLEWPSISYHGFVKVHGNSSSMVILKVDNRLVQINEGDSYESVLKVKRAYRDSILLEMNGERRVFQK